MGTLSLGELFDERVSVGRPNLLLKKGKSLSVGNGGTEKKWEELLKKSHFY